MERYYYHGIETFLDDEASCLEMMIDIIKSGAIKTFNNVNGTNSEGMNHICLYKILSFHLILDHVMGKLFEYLSLLPFSKQLAHLLRIFQQY